MASHDVFIGTTQAHAYIGNDQVHHTFKFNPDQVQWSYQENTSSRDTIGGRVVQLLSVAVDGITVAGRAGSREELQRLSDNVAAIMNYHVKTLRPVSFRVPSRRWDFRVYITAMPQAGWDVAATSYPYQLQLSVEEDLTGVQAKKIEAGALLKLYEGIGYNPAFHGGDAKGFDKVVNTVLKAANATGSTNDSVGASVGGIASSIFYRNPFRDAQYSAARIDAGVDMCGTGPVYAIGPGTIVNVGAPSNTSTFGSNMSVYRLTDGPASGKMVFFAEHYSTARGLRNGQSIDSNTILYNLRGCIEIGWSDGTGSLAWNTAGRDIEGERTALGQNFSDLLVALGAKPGTTSGRPITGRLPAGWPTNWRGRV